MVNLEQPLQQNQKLTAVSIPGEEPGVPASERNPRSRDWPCL